ncbi:hypothetical protein BC826DRAFT_431849 [Russula brevipes]|nr:hypothetical protein BC826DRAFT_431849 [Russula brevipes]
MSVLCRIREENGKNKPMADYWGISVTVINPMLALTWKIREVGRHVPQLENGWIMVSFLLKSNPSLITMSLAYIFTRIYIGKKTRFRSESKVK